ncbi:MAG: DegT/DnrJ/EryC1/StrS family aminotransferase [Armatimonadetes bacterium]|nr:DegT/DnrJ/EryC1/StrS family aminotransferase [Armatimonadota bacterium]
MSERASDFRYSVGEARVPWAAVGEHLNVDDVMAIVRFLVQPQEDASECYEEAARRAREAIEQMFSVGRPVGKLTLGDRVKQAERTAAAMLRCKYALLLTNATAGFRIAYKMAGLKPGDEVICPAITFISTILYPLSIGAKVVFADLDMRTINMDPEDVARKVTDRTRMIVPVHIGGYPVDMDPIMEIARERGIMVLEDAAHAFGAWYKGRAVGTIGDFGAYSFHEVKNITAGGEGGLLVTNDDRFGPQLSLARFVGLDLSKQIPNWLYDVVPLEACDGLAVPENDSVTELQAVILLSQMQRLDQIIAKRRERANYLNERFAEVEGLIPAPADTEEIKTTWHLYLLQIDPQVVGADVQALKKKLQEKGVTNIPHFAPLYKFELLRRLGYDHDEIAATCPRAEELFNRRFTHLPLYPLEDDQVEYMADAVIEAVQELRAGK